MASTEFEHGIHETLEGASRLRGELKQPHQQPLAQALDSLNEALAGIAKNVGGRGGKLASELSDAVDSFADVIDRFAPELRARALDVLSGARYVLRKLHEVGPRSLEIPSRPLFGALPVARVIPQDVHSVIDYANGITVGTVGLFANSDEARIAGLALGGSVLGVSMITDYRLSLLNLVPIEAHEAIDYVWAFSCIAAPFVLGYAKKDPIATLVHVAVGASTILVSLFTDYRAARGAGRSDAEVAAIAGANLQTGIGSRAHT